MALIDPNASGQGISSEPREAADWREQRKPPRHLMANEDLFMARILGHLQPGSGVLFGLAGWLQVSICALCGEHCESQPPSIIATVALSRPKTALRYRHTNSIWPSPFLGLALQADYLANSIRAPGFEMAFAYATRVSSRLLVCSSPLALVPCLSSARLTSATN